MGDRRNNHAVNDLRFVLNTHHARDGETVNISVNEADLQSLLSQSRRKVSVMEDLLTPPLPEVTAMTRVSESGCSKRNITFLHAAVQLFSKSLLLFIIHNAHDDRN